MKNLSGARIRRFRLEAGISQSEMAAKAGISPSYLNLIEHDRRRIPEALAAALAQILGILPGQLDEDRNQQVGEGLQLAFAESKSAGFETEPVDDLLLRFPKWSALLVRLHRKTNDLERVLAVAHDRMRHDPFLPDTLHEVLSAATSVQATAEILTETEDLEPDWRRRFEQNLTSDTRRLSRLAGDLASYLGTDALAEQSGPLLAREEAEAFAARVGWDFDQEPFEVSDEAARLIAHWAQVARSDRVLVPDQVLDGAEDDPLIFALRLGVPVASVFRRLAFRAGSTFGLVVVDASGQFLLRKPVPGFSLPRADSGCPLWPVFSALQRPMTPIETHVVVQNGPGLSRAFRLRAYGSTRALRGFGGPDLREAMMLIEPQPGAGADLLAVGPTCRICRETQCGARRDRSIFDA